MIPIERKIKQTLLKIVAERLNKWPNLRLILDGGVCSIYSKGIKLASMDVHIEQDAAIINIDIRAIFGSDVFGIQHKIAQEAVEISKVPLKYMLEPIVTHLFNRKEPTNADT